MHLKCNYHFSTIVKQRVTKSYFQKPLLKPSEIPSEFSSYFNIPLYLNKKKTNYYSPIRVVKYDILILIKLPTSEIFHKYLEIMKAILAKSIVLICLKFFKMNILREKINLVGNTI